MSQYDDSSKLQLNHKKRSRWNTGNEDDDDDDGEIPESDTNLRVVNNAHTVAVGGNKRLRPTTTLSDSYKTDHYRGMKITNNVSGDRGIIKKSDKKSREELERERQIRMAAIRGETDIDETSNHRHGSNNNNHTTQQQPDSLASHTINNNQKTKKKASKGNRGDAVNQSKTTTTDPEDHVGGANVDGEYDDNDDDEDDETAKAMEELFGITNFGSTKNTKVITNHTSAAIGTIAKHLKPRKYRQYMNRKNGFNRPLDNV